ncbi:hypothetical protein [Streptomyces marianii]|uniref:hypothetical protein n=1 Tax=Streptomyces marianii TaxID=1817406 RepID=UPI0014868B7D|nr:hypothetical protein [Streptomyces marianii]
MPSKAPGARVFPGPARRCAGRAAAGRHRPDGENRVAAALLGGFPVLKERDA